MKMLALNRIGELDVDAEVVRVQLQAIVGPQPRVLAHVHRERGDRTVERQLPVLVLGRAGLERDRLGGGLLHRLHLEASYYSLKRSFKFCVIVDL
jgi:hypothetical protein